MAASTPPPFVPSTPAQAKALAHPTRHRLLHELREPASVSRLAHRLAMNKGNVAHHLGVLEAAGLVRRHGTRTVRGGTEVSFVRIAPLIRFEAGPDASGTVAMMEDLTAEFAADPQALLHHRILRLTAPQAGALAARLDRFVHELEPAGDREQEYAVVVGVYRRGRRR